MGEEEKMETGGGVEMEEHKVAVVEEEEEEEEEVRAQVYPAPLHSHEEVVRDKLAFMESLRRFHSSMSTKFMIPVIGGRELDLHLLYVEVTRRGGLAKVIEEKKWREVIAAFKFPPTTTSASFVLRRYYLSLIHHYEQVYYFRAQGGLIPPAASSQTRTPPGKLERGVVVSDSTMQTSKTRKRPLPEPQNRGPYNFTVTGSIDGKFEYGYMVTVKIGSDTLRGVLYHVHQPSASSSTLAKAPPETANAAPSSSAVTRTRLRRRRGCRHRDPAHPKPNRSAYNFFFAEKHSKLKTLYPHREREFSKMIGESWNKLSLEERTVYQDYGQKDKERYKREMQEYKEKLKLVQPEEVGRPEPEPSEVVIGGG